MQTSQFLADKMAGYVTVPVNTSNASTQNLAENYKAFYSATVNRYNGILVDTSNYEYDLISGRTPAEEFEQTSITVNRNYLDFNPIYDVSGRQITSTQLSDTRFNVLLPTSREQEKESWSEFVQTAYGMEANFIPYDGTASKPNKYSFSKNGGNINSPSWNTPLDMLGAILPANKMSLVFSFCVPPNAKNIPAVILKVYQSRDKSVFGYSAGHMISF